MTIGYAAAEGSEPSEATPSIPLANASQSDAAMTDALSHSQTPGPHSSDKAWRVAAATRAGVPTAIASAP